MEILGNSNILERYRIGFLAGSKTCSLSVLPSLDWAVEVAKREDVVVVSGFHSSLEREVLKFLLKGRCGIVCVLARTIYKRVPENFLEAYDSGRVLFIAPFETMSVRAGRQICQKRNEYVASISDQLVLSSFSPDSSLRRMKHGNMTILTS